MFSDLRKFFESTPRLNIVDPSFLENTFIPALGLNNENLNEQPSELNDYFGGGLGLRIWQYPNQFSKYLHLISEYSSIIQSYMEIGCRFGGTFITHVEYLSALNPRFREAIAVDLIECPPNLVEYQKVNPKVSFMQANSCTEGFATFLEDKFFDLIFIDGDHSYEGVKNDAELTRDKCNIQVFHDITSDPCPGVGQYWRELQQTHGDTFTFHEFTDQYDSVKGTFLGIGVAVKKRWKAQ